MSLLLGFYGGTPLLRRAQALNQIVQLLLTAPDPRLVQLWARDIHDTFNNMDHKLLASEYGREERLSVAEAENLAAGRLENVLNRLQNYMSNSSSQVSVEEMLGKGRLTSFEQLVQGCQLDPSLLPTKSWFEEVIANYTFRESQKRTDYARPEGSNLRELTLDLWNLRSRCEHGMVAQDHCHLCRGIRQFFTTRCHAILTTFSTDSDWNTLNSFQKRGLMRMVATMKDNLQIVIEEGQVPLELSNLSYSFRST